MTERKVKVVNTSGKRKTAVARATTTQGKGRIRINKVPLEIHQPELARLKIMEALKIAGDRMDTVDINIKAHGGGIMGQAEAIRTAISRGIVEFYERYHNDHELRGTYLH
ncbi:MAG: 30S ribosomal protein S9, partial [Thermoplasmata archaeon]|nr:30S ribosomal protein S9 [Thermoplasmata archaeon]